MEKEIIIKGTRNVTEECYVRNEGDSTLSKGILIHSPNEDGLFGCTIDGKETTVKIRKYSVNGITLVTIL